MSVVDTWDGCRSALAAQLRTVTDSSHAARQIKLTLERIQHETMTEQKDANLRQQIAILFSLLKASCDMMQATGTPKLWISGETEEKKKKFSSRILFGILFAGFILATGIICFYQKDIITVLLIGFAAVSSLAYAIANLLEKKNREKQMKPLKYKIELQSDADKIIACFDKLFPSMDRYIQELAFLNMQKNRQASEIDEELLDFCAQMLEAQRAGSDAYVFQVLPAVEQYLRHLGIEILEFNRSSQRYFQVLPAKEGERTICPALLKDGKLLRAGIAAVCDSKE